MASPETARYVVGIDAGNTKTVAAVADLSGRVCGYARGQSGNIYAGLAPIMNRLKNVFHEALSTAGLKPSDVTHLTISATGADWPEDFVAIREAALERRMVQDESGLSVVNDAVGSLWAGSPSGEGVVVAAGTSAGTAARCGERVWHSSYWQQHEGAVELGRAGLKAVYLAELGLEFPTKLTSSFLDVLELPTAEALLHAFTARQPSLGPADAGRLARVVLDEAEAGDEVALRLAAAHGSALGDYVRVAARKVGFGSNFPLVLTGGLMRHSGSALRNALVTRVRVHAPDVLLQTLAFEPVGGALCVSLSKEGSYTLQARGLLRDTLPHTTFFAT